MTATAKVGLYLRREPLRLVVVIDRDDAPIVAEVAISDGEACGLAAALLDSIPVERILPMLTEFEKLECSGAVQ